MDWIIILVLLLTSPIWIGPLVTLMVIGAALVVGAIVTVYSFIMMLLGK